MPGREGMFYFVISRGARLEVGWVRRASLLTCFRTEPQDLSEVARSEGEDNGQ
jgi:hypothetical protein